MNESDFCRHNIFADAEMDSWIGTCWKLRGWHEQNNELPMVKKNLN
jgi:hypothetical protein